MTKGRPPLSNTSQSQSQWDGSPNRRNHAQKTVNEYVDPMSCVLLAAGATIVPMIWRKE